ncbi:hypothetical protein [Streptomyces sp. V2I9]|uniref:hypothetical protein n=1 Tax=Streptomyces sp. V2I9 TaxID=3042304 RepID=UPI00277DF52F|nr:hypothetical protein [Streptomyces sp. V2I9]MDQ0985001.1 hypothetical protein [Streptomyces sp. V2I9]
MGDWFQTYVDTEATAEDAPRLAGNVRDWLISESVIAAERQDDCVLGWGPGYPPGKRYADITEDRDPGLLSLSTNGLRLEAGRSVFFNGGSDPSAATCPHCRQTTVLVDRGWQLIPEKWALFQDAVHSWDTDDDEPVACPSCGRAARVDTWGWADDSIVFGHLGFTFWNWPTLRHAFELELTKRLDGHRTVLLAGKL